MGSLGNGNGRTTSTEINPVVDVGFAETQPLENEFSYCSSPGGKYDVRGDNEWKYLDSTVPFNDFTLVEDALETQPVNLASETQILNIDETQLLEDIDGAGDMDTQLLDEIDGVGTVSDGEGTDRTEVLENVDDLSANDPQCQCSAKSVDSKELLCEPFNGHREKKLLEQSGPNNEQKSSNSMPPRFTYLRAEFMRQAALAARNMALEQTKDKTNSVMGTTSQSQQPLTVKDDGQCHLRGSEKVREVDQEYDSGKYGEVEGSMENIKCKAASSVVRKLFCDDLPTNKKGASFSSYDVNGEGSLAKLPVCDGELAGLSYVDSQEPGELSQANALDFVDKFLKDNISELDREANHVKNVQENIKYLPITKGQQDLAKRANDRGKARKTGIYDWDDSLEDEGGGDIFIRRKEEFLVNKSHGRKSLPGVQKINARRPNDNKDEDNQSSIPNERMNAFHSDSRLVLHNLKVRDNAVQERATKSRRNLSNELDELYNINSSKGQLKYNATAADAQEMLDVGLDTQMAAEAMETLCNGDNIVHDVAHDATCVTRSGLTDQLNNYSTGETRKITSEECLGQYGRKRKFYVKSDLPTSSLLKGNRKTKQLSKKEDLIKRSKRSKLIVKDKPTSSACKYDNELPAQNIEQRKLAGSSKRHKLVDSSNSLGGERGSRGSFANKEHLQGEVYCYAPIAHRTRRSLLVNPLMKPDRPSRSFSEEDGRIGSFEKRNRRTGIKASKGLDHKSTIGCSDLVGVDENTKLSQLKKSASNLSVVNNGTKLDTLDCPRRKSLRKLSSHNEGSANIGSLSDPSGQSTEIGKCTDGKRKMRAARGLVESKVNCKAQKSLYGHSVREPNLDKANPMDAPICCIVDKDANLNSNREKDADVLLSAKHFEVTRLDESPGERCKSSDLASTTPANCKTPVNDASPICMGEDYYKQSCNRNLSKSCLIKVFSKELNRELRSLSILSPESITPSKDSRKRRDMTDVQILYSHHLDEDIIKHQKKILVRLGASVASSITDATHFIADQFVRTRNMLEAIASGKPVVTHLWIESCGQASCFIDEKNYILRDAKKEKEFGFSMPVSLARATQHPLLEGWRVLITPNTKPSMEIISSLVKAVQGQALQRIGRSVMKDDKIPDDMLILSCEEDYDSCVPFLEKGAAVYSSELLLNGIVTQRLEYERHRLFSDQVKKTRSTIWLKRDGRTFLPVTDHK